MKKQGRGRVLCGALAGCLWAFPSLAAPAAPASLRVTGTSVRAAAQTAEFCLSFSAPLAADAAQIAKQLVLKDEAGRRLAFAVQDLRLSGSELCLGGLDHGASYTLLLGRIEGEAGSRLAKNYSHAFEVPHRKASLSFVAQSDRATFPRLDRKAQGAKVGEDEGAIHLLRSVNVETARLTLYKLEAGELAAPAWQQFTQNARTPSEGLYFARTQGRSVFETELVFAGKPDEDQSLLAPLPPDLAPGLYFLAAAPQGKEADNPALFAGQWFIVSDVRAGAALTGGGAEVFVANQTGEAPRAGVKVSLLSRKGKVLAQGVTNAQGRAFLALEDKDRTAAGLLFALDSNGGPDLLDLRRAQEVALKAPAAQASVRPDQEEYASGAKAALTLQGTDAQGAPRALDKGSLRLLRPDGSLYSQSEVTAEDGAALVLFPLPIAQETEDWTLSWSEKDGEPLAQTTLRIKAQGASGDVRAEVPAAAVPADKAFAVGLAAVQADGQPMPFASGRLIVRAVRARHEGWTDYKFGLPVDPRTQTVRFVPFIADEEGKARLLVRADDLGPDVTALEITPQLEGGARGGTKTVRLGSRGAMLGLKPMQGDRIAPGITVARLGVVALDGEGRKKNMTGLNYALIEEGRSFEWYPGDGYWEYKPLPQRRRVAGGPLELGADGEAVVSLPLTPGQYAFELAQGGRPLARAGFVIGPDGALAGARQGQDVLSWAGGAPQTLEAGKTGKLSFRLDKKALVALIVSDGAVRHVQVKPLQAGVRTLDLPVGEDWGAQTSVRLLALADGLEQPALLEATLPVADPRRVVDISASLPSGSVVGGKELTVPLRAALKGRAGKNGKVKMALIATPIPTDGSALEPIILKDIPLDAAGKGKLLLPVPSFDGTLRLFATASSGKAQGSRVWDVPVTRALAVQGRPPARMVQGDRADIYLTFVNEAGPEAAYTYDLRAPKGLVIKGETKGRLALGRKASQTIALSLEAKTPLLGQIELVVHTPSGIEQRTFWPLTVSGAALPSYGFETKTLPAGGKIEIGGAAAEGRSFSLLGPLALPPSTMRLLHTLMTQPPMTTIELARWLQAAALWHEPLVKSGLAGADRLQALRQERLDQLQRRQNEDGGFSSTRSGRSSDLESTAAALGALSGVADEPSRRAVQFLTQKLENTWFDEAERPARALAFEALDAARAPMRAGVRYFAETSRDKDLPSASAAALALVFARGEQDEDKAKAAEWTRRSQKTERAEDWLAAGYAASNRLIGGAAWDGLHAPDIEPARTGSLQEASLALIAYGRAALAEGPWRVESDGKTDRYSGFAVLPQEKRKIKNLWDRPLVLSLFTQDEKKTELREKLRAGPTVDLRFFESDGTPLAAGVPLAFGRTYFLAIDVRGRVAGEKTARLSVPVSGAFDARTPPVGAGEQLREALSGLPFTPDEALERSVTSDAVRWTFNAQAPWRGVMVLRAIERGQFVWPAPRLETEDGERLAAPHEPLRFTVK